MKQESINKTINRYRKRISEYGTTFESLGSGSLAHQSIRFEMLKTGIKSGDSVLDIGCGLGDFYHYLLSCDINVDYYGVDIVPEFIKTAEEKYPQAEFQIRNILEEPFKDNSFDFVVCSQVLNLRLKEEDNLQHAKDMLKSMNSFCRKSVACDFLTSYVD